MAAQKATELRRLLADVEANEKALRLRQDELESQLLAAPGLHRPLYFQDGLVNARVKRLLRTQADAKSFTRYRLVLAFLLCGNEAGWHWTSKWRELDVH
jgi:hypothetical protein